VVEIIRDRKDDLVARIEDPEGDIEKGLVSACGDHETVPVDLTDFDTVLSREFLGNAFPERKDPGYILILVIRRLGEEPRDFRDGCGRGPVVNDAKIAKEEATRSIHSLARWMRVSSVDTVDRFSFTFAKMGSYGFFCGLHPQKQGRTVVTPRGARSSSFF
jgi:hypothetical protein